MSSLFSAFGSHHDRIHTSPTQDSTTPISIRSIPRAEKDADDPTSPSASARALNRNGSTTLTTLSRLFAAQSSISPGLQRNASSYLERGTGRAAGSERPPIGSSTSLPEHLYARGFLDGRHSDITVVAFGKAYKLHRLILDRAPFFASALNAKWLESDAKELIIHPEDIDPSITQTSFELALKRLYGHSDTAAEENESVSLFATGCWLEMHALVHFSIETILRQTAPDNLAIIIGLVVNNYYGRAGERILTSAKAMLCREGWRMPFRFWDGIPAKIVCDVVGGDGFFVHDEWERWVLAKRLLNRRLESLALLAGLVEPGRKKSAQKRPMSTASTKNPLYSASHSTGHTPIEDSSTSQEVYIALYSNAEVKPIKLLLNEKIHYLHLSFEQLLIIRQSRDALGFPIVNETIVNEALWRQMELRQRVLNAQAPELEIGLRQQSNEGPDRKEGDGSGITTPLSSDIVEVENEEVNAKADAREMRDGTDHSHHDQRRDPHKFWIPSTDSNIIVGGAEPVVTTPRNTGTYPEMQDFAHHVQPEDVQQVADSTSPLSSSHQSASKQHVQQLSSYTSFPPFRFAVEFPDPRTLKERKRVYSRTVFYAGSFWNLYIQKIYSSRNRQLGVYLHRAKDYGTEENFTVTAGLSCGNVDERIGQLERNMSKRKALRRERRELRQSMIGHDRTADPEGVEGSDAEGDGENLPLHSPVAESGRNSTGMASSIRNLLHRDQHNARQAERTISTSLDPYDDKATMDSRNDLESDIGDDDDDESESERMASAFTRTQTPTIPPYIDRRPTIKTYFKIFSPSRGGRMMSIYESAPDQFDFSQSWGWKSSTLMLEDGSPDDRIDDLLATDESKQTGVVGEDEYLQSSIRAKADGKLRFMVVIGIV